MRLKIDKILEGLPRVKIEQIGNLWRINLANFVGARSDGISLAYDLRAQYEKAQQSAIKHQDEIESLGITPAYNVRSVEVLPVEKKVAEPIPDGLADLLRENEPYGEAQARLWALYVGLQNKLMLGISNDADARLHTRLHGHLAWISKGAVEVTRD